MEVVAAHPSFGNPHTVKILATYLSALGANPRPVEGPGDHLRLGQETFAHICAACHGADGGGSRDHRAPRIGQQHYPYVRRQIELAVELHEEFAPPAMTSALRSMSSQQKDAVADYVSRLGSANTSSESDRLD